MEGTVPQRLTEIDVDEISLVGKPANRRQFTLLKMENEDMADTDTILDQLQKLSADERAEIIEKMAPESEQAWRERVLKAIEDDDTEVLKDDRALDVVVDELKKMRDVVAEVRTAQKEAEAAILKEQHTARRKSYIEKAGDYAKIPGLVADDFGEILMKCEDALTEDEVKKLNEILKAAAEGMSGVPTEELGSGVDEGADVLKQVESLIRKEMEADPKLTEAQARAEVYRKEPGILARELEAEGLVSDESGAGEEAD
jgi:hypothetical protein